MCVALHMSLSLWVLRRCDDVRAAEQHEMEDEADDEDLMGDESGVQCHACSGCASALSRSVSAASQISRVCKVMVVCICAVSRVLLRLHGGVISP